MQTKMRGCRNLLLAAGAALGLTAPAWAEASGQDAADTTQIASVPMHIGQPARQRATERLVVPSKRFGFDPAQAMVYQIFDPVDEAVLRLEDEQEMAVNGVGRLRVGVVRDIDYPLTELDPGWQEIARGRVWSATLLSPDAKAIRAHFSGVDLPKGAELWVYAPGSEQQPEVFYADHGPRARADFWSTVFPGDTLIIEYYVPASVDEAGAFAIDRAVHDYRSAWDFADGGDAPGPRDCHLDVMCYPAWHPLHEATVKIEYNDGGGSYLCSATLLNTVASDETPYVMTADHCIDNQTSAESIVFRWLYETSECDGGNGIPFSSTTADFIWSRGSMDASLIMALGEVPDEAVWAGWDINTVSNGTDLVGIHHPGGALKKISFGDKITHPFGDPLDYHGVLWNAGTIEGGSSGSGLYRAGNHSYVGIASHSDAPLGCTNPDGPSGYGRFDRAYPYIQSQLAAGSDDDFDNYGANNDTCGEGTFIANGVYNNLIVKSTDEDWYSVYVEDGDTLTVTLDFTDRYGNIDIALYDVCGGNLLAYSDSTNNDEMLSYPNNTGSAQFFKLHVYLASDTRNEYNMTLASGTYDPPLEHMLTEVPITQAAISDDPALANAQCFDLQAVVDVDDDWTSTDATASVDGSFYQHSQFNADVPQGQLWGVFPSLEFDSFFSAPNFTTPGFADGPHITNNSMSAIWFDTPDTGGGTFTIGRFTVTSGTTLSVSGNSTAKSTQGELLPFALEAEINIGNDCEGDLTGDGLRDQSDLGVLLASYGTDGGGDIDGDGDTDQADLGILLAVYGVPCP